MTDDLFETCSESSNDNLHCVSGEEMWVVCDECNGAGEILCYDCDGTCTISCNFCNSTNNGIRRKKHKISRGIKSGLVVKTECFISPVKIEHKKYLKGTNSAVLQNFLSSTCTLLTREDDEQAFKHLQCFRKEIRDRLAHFLQKNHSPLVRKQEILSESCHLDVFPVFEVRYKYCGKRNQVYDVV